MLGRAAARAMHLSQSALTKALRELEEDVGAELLHRSYKGIGFTAEGNALLVRARLVLSTLEKARAEIRLMCGGAGVSVKAAITPLLVTTVLASFRRAQPDAEQTFHEGLLVQALPALIEGQIDFAIALATPGSLPFEIDLEPLAMNRPAQPAIATAPARHAARPADPARRAARQRRTQARRPLPPRAGCATPNALKDCA